MTKQELQIILQEKGIPKISYNLDGDRYGECLCLVKINDEYKITYNSRGIIDEIKCFEDESSACEFILNRLLRGYHGLK